MNIRFCMAATALAVTLGAGAFVVATVPREHMESPRAIAATQPMLQRVDLDGADVARLLQLRAYKWTYQLPTKSAGTTDNEWLSLWIEEWHRASKQPKIVSLGSTYLSRMNSNSDNTHTLSIRLPREGETSFVYDTGSSTTGGDVAGVNFSANSISAAQSEHLTFDRDITLLSLTKNAPGAISRSDFKSPEFTRFHDRTVFVKARFTRQAGDKALGAPVWKGGKIVFE